MNSSPSIIYNALQEFAASVTAKMTQLTAGEPDGAMLLQHLSHTHPDRVGAYLARMHRDEDITAVAAEAFEVVEGA